MPPTPFVHISFVSPARVMLMDKSTPCVAVTAEVVGLDKITAMDSKAVDTSNMIVQTKVLFPANGGPVKATITMLINRAHIVSIVPVQGTP